MRAMKIFISAKAGVILLAMAASLALAGHPLAYADNSDEVFTTVLDMYSVPYSSRAVAITEGHEVCSVLDQPSGNLVAAGLNVMNVFPDMSLHEAGQFVGAAVGAYCPRHDDLYHGGT